MPNRLDFNLSIQDKDHALQLYADGAIYWPAKKTLFLTDPHFGKSESFRHVGIAIPTAVIHHDLNRITQHIEQTQAQRLIVLGDFFHTRHSQSDYVLETLTHWRGQHQSLVITLVQGNHDRHAGPPPNHLNIMCVEEPYCVDPFACYHHPQPTSNGNGYILAGHLHPYILMRGRAGTSMRLAAFIFTPHQAILPAFGGFTGGSIYKPTTQDRVFAIGQGEIVEIPTRPQTNDKSPTTRRT